MPGLSVDPRSTQFRVVLTRVSAALKFLALHPAIRDCEQYLTWLKLLQRRANSLVAKVREGGREVGVCESSCVELQ